MFMKNSSKIIMITFIVLLAVVIIDFTKDISLLHKAIFIAATGVLALIFQKIGEYYTSRPLKLPRWLQRLTLGRAVMEEIDRINDIIDPIDAALCRLERRLESCLLKNGKVEAMGVNEIAAQIDKLFTTEGGDVSDN